MKHLWLSIRTILRFKTYTAINVTGLALSLACVFVLARYIHQERTVNHFIPELERTFLTTVIKEGDPPRLSESLVRNNDPNYRNPLDHPEVESFSRFVILRDDYVESEGYRNNVHTLVADSSFFQLVPYPCVEGTLRLKPDEALLTSEAARRMFGNESPIGRSIRTSSGKYVTIVGVVGQPSTKSSFCFDVVLSRNLIDWPYVFFELVRLYRAADVDKVNQMNAKPMNLGIYRGMVRYRLMPLKDFYLGKEVQTYRPEVVLQGNADALRLMAFVAGLILLVGLFNYANLYTVVMLKRSRELGVKKVLGAGRGQILMQLYVENVCLNVIAVFFVWLLVEVTRMPVERWFEIPVQADWRFDVLLSAFVIFVLPLFTSLPSYWRYVHAAPMRSLSQVAIGGKFVRTRVAFLFLQYVITFCLVVAAVYLIHHLHYLLHTDVGYRTENIIQCRFWTENPDAINNGDAYEEEAARAHTAWALIEKRVAESPLCTGMVYGEHPYNIQYETEFTADNGLSVPVRILYTSREFMDFFGFRMAEGRKWGDEDVFTQYKAIVNKAFLRALHITYWRTAKVTPKERLWWSVGESNDNLSYEIVGVMDDFLTGHLADGNRPIAFVFSEPDKRDDCFISVVSGKEREAVAFLQDLYVEAVGTGDFEYSFLTDEIAALHEQDRKVTRIMATFALIAIGISCLGLFGLSLYDIRQHYREIALRKVNGAQASDIYRLLLKKYVYILGAALMVGSAIAYACIEHYMEQFANRAPLSPWIFGVAGVSVAVVALFTLIWQIRRATRINPAEVMKSE